MTPTAEIASGVPKRQNTALAEPLQQVDRTYVLWRGKKLSYFGGCDYLRLSTHPAVVDAVSQGLRQYGLNVAASRKTTGNHLLFSRVETAVARFFRADCARLVSNGYLTNLVAAQGLHGTIDHVLIDERAHSSLRDAALFLKSKVSEFKHRNLEDLSRKFSRLKVPQRVAVLTDGLFAHDGSFAPLRDYRQALGSEVLLWVDDAHAGGIVGKNGRGSLEAAGLNRHNVLQTVTFSKAFGVYGGAVLCDEAIGTRILQHSCAMVGNTPLPLPLAAAVLESLRLVRTDRDLRKRLSANIRSFWNFVGVTAAEPLSPVFSLTPRDPEKFRMDLLRRKIYPPFIHYPGGPKEGYFRFALSSEHTAQQIEALADVVSSATVVAR